MLLGVAQEKQRSFKAQKGAARRAATPSISRANGWRSISNTSISAIASGGPAFLKTGTYLPYPVKVYLNAHEWVKQQLRRQRLRLESLDNGFLTCPDRRRCRRPVMRWAPVTCRPSSIAGRSDCAGH